jgi:hypothetical protein
VGSWINDGVEYEDTIRAALAWNQLNTPPLPENEVLRTVDSIWRTHLRKHKEKTRVFSYKKNIFYYPLFTANPVKVHKPGTIRFKKKTQSVDSEWVVFGSADLGLGGPFEDRVFTFLLKKIVEKGRPANPVVIPSLKSFTKEIFTRPPGGREIKQVRDSLFRIKATEIVTRNTFFNADKNTVVDVRFNLIDAIKFMGTSHSDERTIIVWLGHLLIKNLQAGYSLPLNFETYLQINNYVARTIYKLLYPSIHKGRQTKALLYEDIVTRCDLRPEKQKWRIEKQLQKAIRELLESRIILDCTIINGRNGW